MNKYDVVKTIGEGAYGVVLQCRNKETNELVAIKRFKESDEDELVRKTTLREVRILRLLKDEPYVVRLQEAFRRKGKLYLVFDYVGCNLLDVLEQQPQGLPTDDIRRMVFTMLLGIRACHANGVIHRDIKPENLLVHEDNTLRLCDFGFARIYSTDMNDLTDYVATRWYRSPELLLGTSDYGLPSDMWAVGCIMAELIDGQAIFPCETEVDQIFVIQKLLGNFTPQQMETFRKNPRFNGYSLKELPKTESSLDRKFTKKASKKGLSLLKQMLVIDPSKRCTVDEALNHPFFEGLAEIYYPQLNKNLVTPYIRPPSANANGGTTKIPALARPASSLATKQQQPRVGTPSDSAHHGHGAPQQSTTEHYSAYHGGDDMGGEHDGSPPLTGNGARGASPWGGGGTALPRPNGVPPPSSVGGSMLPPARLNSAHRHYSNDPAMGGGGAMSNRVATPGFGSSINANPPSGGPVVQGMLVGSMGMGGGFGVGGSGVSSNNYGVPQAPNAGIASNVGSFTGRNSSAVRLPVAPTTHGQGGNLPRIDVPHAYPQSFGHGYQPVHPTGVGSSYAPTAPTTSPQQQTAMTGGVAGNAYAMRPGMTVANGPYGSVGTGGVGVGGGYFSRPDLVNGGQLPPRTGGVYSTGAGADPYKYQQPPQGNSTSGGYRPKMY